MAFRKIPVALQAINPEMGTIDNIVAPIMQDVLEAGQNHAKEHLSGVPFTSSTGTHTINKRTGHGAASVQVQYPYGSPFRGRIFAFASTQYADNPEAYNYLAILEGGRGEIRPRYTSSVLNGNPKQAALTIPGGSNYLIQGQGEFRGMTGNYKFVKYIGPMEGKGWLEAAIDKTSEEVPAIVEARLKGRI